MPVAERNQILQVVIVVVDLRIVIEVLQGQLIALDQVQYVPMKAGSNFIAVLQFRFQALLDVLIDATMGIVEFDIVHGVIENTSGIRIETDSRQGILDKVHHRD